MRWALASLITAAMAIGPQQYMPGQATPLSVDSSKVVDLTHVLADGIPDFEGDLHAFKYKMKLSVAKDGYGAGEYHTPEHLGTHVDAPSHFAAGNASIDQLPASKLIVPCVVIDVRNEATANADYSLPLAKIKDFEKGGQVPKGAAVLLLTGWSDRWTKPAAYRNADDKGIMHFPGFSQEAAEFLVKERNVAYIGTDTFSTDPGNSTTYPVHHKVLAEGVYMIENLDALSKVPPRGALLVVAPLRIKDGTGCQARVFAILP